MINTEVIKSKVLSFIERNGPSLPMQIAKELGMNSIFASAFLSELLDSKKIKTSSVRVGGTYLYLIPGQEAQLEKFHNYLHPKEVEAYEKLKQNRVLKDSEQDPAIRVALRAIKDFAFSFKNDEEIYWRYLTTTEQEIRDLFSKPIKQEIKPEITEKISEVIISKPTNNQEIVIEEKSLEIKREPKIEDLDLKKSEPALKQKSEKQKKQIQAIQTTFENPLALKPLIKEEKIKPKSEFVLQVIEFLENNQFKIIEEKEYSKKEYNCIVELPTKLGPIAFLTQAKEKKSISDADLDPLLRQAQAIPLPALLIYPETISKKALEYQAKFYSILKTLKIE